MKHYAIREILTELDAADKNFLPETWVPGAQDPFVIVLTRDEWNARKERFDMGIELEPNSDIHIHAAHADHRMVRHELPAYAGAGKTVGLPDGIRALYCDYHQQSAVLQKEKVAVRGKCYGILYQ